MGFSYRFHELEDTSQLRQLVAFMAAQDLRYPRYDEWVQRAETELDEGTKRAIIATDGKIIGNAVWQTHKVNASLLELKNLRIDSRLRGRGFARFMLRQVTIAGRKQGYAGIMCDLREDHPGVTGLLQQEGYIRLIERSLYDPHVPDVVMFKPLTMTPSQGLHLATRMP